MLLRYHLEWGQRSLGCDAAVMLRRRGAAMHVPACAQAHAAAVRTVRACHAVVQSAPTPPHCRTLRCHAHAAALMRCRHTGDRMTVPNTRDPKKLTHTRSFTPRCHAAALPRCHAATLLRNYTAALPSCRAAALLPCTGLSRARGARACHAATATLLHCHHTPSYLALRCHAAADFRGCA